VIRFTIVVSLTVMLACTPSQHAAHEPEVLRVEDLPADFRVPGLVWDQTLPTDALLKPKPVLYGPVQVKLIEKNKDTLKDNDVIYEFPSGGGELDLAQVTTEKPGSFFLSFHMPLHDKLLNKKVYFISQSRQRRVDGEILGSGCRKLLDLSSTIGQLEFKEQLQINTTRHRHVSILAGHFIFLAETESSWIVSQLSFFDSKRKDLMCPEFGLQASTE
jgi:hypothetical protein